MVPEWNPTTTHCLPPRPIFSIVNLELGALTINLPIWPWFQHGTLSSSIITIEILSALLTLLTEHVEKDRVDPNKVPTMEPCGWAIATNLRM